MSVLSLWPQVVDVRRTRRFLDGSPPFVLKETLFHDHRRRMFDDFTCVWRLHFLLHIREFPPVTSVASLPAGTRTPSAS